VQENNHKIAALLTSCPRADPFHFVFKRTPSSMVRRRCTLVIESYIRLTTDVSGRRRMFRPSITLATSLLKSPLHEHGAVIRTASIH